MVWSICCQSITFLVVNSDTLSIRKYKVSIGQLLRLLCERRGVEIYEAEAFPDPIQILVGMPSKLYISSFEDEILAVEVLQECLFRKWIKVEKEILKLRLELLKGVSDR